MPLNGQLKNSVDQPPAGATLPPAPIALPPVQVAAVPATFPAPVAPPPAAAPLNHHAAVALPAVEAAPQNEGWISWGIKQAAGLTRGVWSGTKNLAVAGKDQVVARYDQFIDEFVQTTLLPTIAKNRQDMTALTGSEEVNQILFQFSVKVGRELNKETAVSFLMQKHPEALLLMVEANVSSMMMRLVDRAKVKAREQRQPFPDRMEPQDLMVRVVALIADLEKEKVRELSEQSRQIDLGEGTPEEKADKKKVLFEAVAQKFILEAFPNGKNDLICPAIPHLDPIKWYLFRNIKGKISGLIGDMPQKLWAFTQEVHPRNVALVVQGGSDGAVVAKQMETVAAQGALFVDNLAKRLGNPQEEGIAQNLRGIMAQQLQPLPKPLGRWIEHVVQHAGDIPALQTLFRQLDNYNYPLLMHLLARLVESADREGLDKNRPVFARIADTLLSSFFNFAGNNQIETYRRAKAILEQRFAAPEQKKLKEAAIVNLKNPYAPLAQEILQKAGLDKAGLATILPMGTEKAAAFLNGEALAFAEDFYEEVIARKGPLVNLDPRLKGYTEGRQLLQGMIAKWNGKATQHVARVENGQAIQEQIVQWINAKFFVGGLSSEQNWIAGTVRELVASPHLPQIEAFAEGYLVDSVSDLFVQLALNYPPVKGHAEIDIVSSALLHVASIAVDKFKNGDLIQQMVRQMAMPEGTIEEKRAKEAAKKRLFGPLSKEILAKAGWDQEANIRLPKMVRGAVKKRVEEDLLPDLIYKGVKLWLQPQTTQAANIAKVKNLAVDGDAVANAMKTVAVQAGNVIAQQATKVGVAFENPARLEGFDYQLRDALVANIDREPALRLLNQPVLRHALVKILKGAGNAEVLAILKQVDKVGYPLLMHVMAHLLESGDKREGASKQAAMAIAINTLIKSVIQFAAANRQILAQVYPAYAKAIADVSAAYPNPATPELKAAKANALAAVKKPFANLFEPLVNEVLKKAGLDSEGLSKVLPFGSEQLSALAKAEALNFCVDFYEEIVVPEGRPPAVAQRLAGYDEGRHLLQGLVQEIMPNIREVLIKEENRRDIQAALADEINKRLFEGKLPLEKDWIAQPVKELMENSPHLPDVRAFAEPYLVDAIGDLLAHLAATYPPAANQPKIDMPKCALAHLVGIVVSEVKDPALVSKLRDWMALPESTDEQKRIKGDAKVKLREELFGACAAKALEKAGWDNLANIRAPKALQGLLKKLLREVVVPDQLFRLCCDMVVPKKFSPVDVPRLEKMGGQADLKILCNGLAEKYTPWVVGQLKDNADLIAAKMNEKLAQNRLDIREEAWLGHAIDGLAGQEVGGPFKPVWQFAETFISEGLNYGLAQLALNYKGRYAGDIGTNIALYLRDLLKNFAFDPRMAELIRIYHEQTAPLREMDRQIAELRKLAVQEHPQVGIKVGEAVQRSKTAQTSLLIAKETEEIDRLLRDKAENPKAIEKLMKRKQALPAKIAAQLEEQFKPLEKFQDRPLDVVLTEQKIARKKMETELDDTLKIKETYQTLLKEFEPKVKQLMADMGFAAPKDLPVPYFLKETLWKNLASHLLPELCLNAAEKMVSAIDELMPNVNEIADYETKLKKRHQDKLPAGEKLPEGSKAPLVAGIYKMADYLVKEIESKVALHGAEGARKALDEWLIPNLYGGEKARLAAIKVLGKHREDIAQWMGEESPELVAIIKERMGKVLRQAIVAPLLKGADQFIANLEKIEKDHPERLFDFVFSIVPLISDHLDLATKIAKKNGKSYIHEVDPLIMVREFEQQNKLHPAMPGFRELDALKKEELHIKQLEEQVKEFKRGGHSEWYQHIDRYKDQLKLAPGKIRDYIQYGPEYYLKEAKENRDLIQKQIETKMKENFYNDFSKYLMEMAGLKGVSDLPGGDAFWGMIGMKKADGWDAVNKGGGWLLMEGMRAAFAPQQLNTYMATLLGALNENLKKRRQQGEMQKVEKVDPVDPRVKIMEDKCRELIDQLKKVLPGSIVQEFSEIPLLDQIPGKLLAEALREVMKQYPLSKIVQEGLIAAADKLPEKIPMNFEELDLAKKKRAVENEKNIEAIRKEAEKTFPLLYERLERNVLASWKKAQAAVDKWIENSPAGRTGLKVKEFFDRICRLVFIDLVMAPTYKSMRWLLQFAITLYSRRVGRFAELGRASLVDTEINANLLFNIGDKLKDLYALR